MSAIKIELNEHELNLLLDALYILEAQRIGKSQIYALINKINVARLATKGK